VRINSATAHMHPSLFEGEPPNSIAGVRLSVVIERSCSLCIYTYFGEVAFFLFGFFKFSLIQDRFSNTHRFRSSSENTFTKPAAPNVPPFNALYFDFGAFSFTTDQLAVFPIILTLYVFLLKSIYAA
jgi:hypothetical protein